MRRTGALLLVAAVSWAGCGTPVSPPPGPAAAGRGAETGTTARGHAGAGPPSILDGTLTSAGVIGSAGGLHPAGRDGTRPRPAAPRSILGGSVTSSGVTLPHRAG
jgi:hypothetical protein